MPEGPELHLSSQFINFISKGRLFAGKIRKNPIHKCAEVEWDEPCYTVAAASRGKELKVFLQTYREETDKKKRTKSGVNDEGKRLHILFNFGMSGKFEFTSANELPKHAHLSFFTNTQPAMALSFVDPRRFGKWQVGTDWSPDRGPCVMFEYPQFRSNVLQNLEDSVFNRPLCEALLNQKYFNGIGNYLRAEIIYRAGVRPFDQARSVLAALSDVPEDVKAQIKDEAKDTRTVKSESPDFLQLCNLLPLEVIGLGTSLYLSKEEFSDESKFGRWLRCYYKSGMKSIADHNKRTMWYHGDAGPLAPKEGRSCRVKRQKVASSQRTIKKQKKELDKETVDTNDTEKARKCRRHKKPLGSSFADTVLEISPKPLLRPTMPQTEKRSSTRRHDNRKEISSLQKLPAAGKKMERNKGKGVISRKSPRTSLSNETDVNKEEDAQNDRKINAIHTTKKRRKTDSLKDNGSKSRIVKKKCKNK